MEKRASEVAGYAINMSTINHMTYVSSKLHLMFAERMILAFSKTCWTGDTIWASVGRSSIPYPSNVQQQTYAFSIGFTPQEAKDPSNELETNVNMNPKANHNRHDLAI